MDEKISLTDYWDMLNRHDWYYDFSDDHRIWKAGVSSFKKIRELAQLSSEHNDLFQRACASRTVDSKFPFPERPE